MVVPPLLDRLDPAFYPPFIQSRKKLQLTSLLGVYLTGYWHFRLGLFVSLAAGAGWVWFVSHKHQMLGLKRGFWGSVNGIQDKAGRTQSCSHVLTRAITPAAAPNHAPTCTPTQLHKHTATHAAAHAVERARAPALAHTDPHAH